MDDWVGEFSLLWYGAFGVSTCVSFLRGPWRPQKSIIECVILAGSSLSRCQGPTPDLIVNVTVLGARSARFFQGFWHSGT